MKILLFAVLALPLAGPAHAMFLGGVEQSFGSDDYKGTKVHAGLNLGAVSITPEYLRYESDRTNGAFHSLGARLSFDTRWVGLGFTVGRVLPHERYSNVSGGADVAVTLSPMGEDGVRRIGGAGRGAAPTGKG
ncbi:MAG: hypothetical protein HY554_08685, partial [Elusimicrobia bacterium]|nr:hypothetical protein [Elusimicrobiota bacterium]